MPEHAVPPLTRQALDQIPALQQDVITYWTSLTTLAAELHTLAADFHHEQVPATDLAAWVAQQAQLLRTVVMVTWKIAGRLEKLQQHQPSEEALDFLVDLLEDDAAPTD